MPNAYSPDRPVAFLTPGNSQSVNLRTAAIDPPSYAVNMRLAGAGGAPKTSNPGNLVTIHHVDSRYVHAGQWDILWFEAVHVDPRSRNLGFILSTQSFTVRVWNAHRYHSRILSSLDVEGPSGISVSGAPALPQHFPPTEQFAYTVQVTASGAPFVANRIVWSFEDIDEESTDLELSGVRLVPWTLQADMGKPIEMRVGFLTDVIDVAERGDEQRIQLTKNPHYGLAFTCLVLEERAAQLVEPLLWNWQFRVYGVPVWQDAVRLESDAGAGQPVISLDTSFRHFKAGGLVFLWKNEFTWEVVTIDSLTSGSVTGETDLKSNWLKSETLVMPMMLGRLSTREEVNWLDVDVNETPLDFDMEFAEE